MKTRFNTYFPPLFLLGEILVLVSLFLLSLYVSSGSFSLSSSYLLGLGFASLVWVGLSFFNKDYKIGRAVSFYHTFKRAFSSVFIFISVLSLIWLLSNDQVIDRQFIITFLLLMFVWISIYRVSVHLILDRYRTFGGNIKYSVIVGYDELGFNLFDLIRKRPQFGIRIKGIYSTATDISINDRYPYLGTIEKLLKEENGNLDFIYISDKVGRSIKNQLLTYADQSLIKVKLLPDIKLDVLKSLVLRRYEHISVIDLNNLPLDLAFNRVVKRGFDIVFSLSVIIGLLSWLYPLLAILIKLDSNGPVLFKQKRHGKSNSEFYCYKFRTMRVNKEADSKWATKGDDRITKLGAFLRRTSLDELPQFFNVLIGQMSIVGPRPHPIKLNEAYEASVQKFANRHAFKPGITGLAQSMGYRGEISQHHQMNSRVRLDRFYLQNWSFVLDIKIIFITISAVIRQPETAY